MLVGRCRSTLDNQTLPKVLLDEGANVAAVGQAHRGPLPSGGKGSSDTSAGRVSFIDEMVPLAGG
jgi:hypothetical protein